MRLYLRPTTSWSRVMSRSFVRRQVILSWGVYCKAHGLRLNYPLEKASKSKSQRCVALCTPRDPLAYGQAVNKRVPIIASDAGGIPLQVKHGKNGWIVPAGESSPVAQLLLDIDKGKEQVHRDLSNGRDFKGKTDPNSVAEAFVGSYDASVPPIKDDKHATSEDFWTVGNTARWLLLISRMLGLEPDAIGANEYGTVDNAEELLKEMGVGESIPGKGSEATNVWKMLIGKDLIDGEGDLI